MHIQSRLDGVEGWIINDTIQDRYVPGGSFNEKIVDLKGEYGLRLQSKQFISQSFLILNTEVSLTRSIKTFSEISGENITMDFSLYGNAGYNIEGLNDKGSYDEGVHNIRYTPALKGEILLLPHEKMNYFLIIFSREFYFHLLSQPILLESAFVQNILNKKHALLTPDNKLNITAEMYKVINDIKNCNKSVGLKRLFIESKVMELFMLQVEQYENIQSQNHKPTTLRLNDKEKILEAKKLLEVTYASPPTLKKLSQLIGLNEFKLKTGFKEILNTTVHGYITELKMNKAKALINNGVSISEVCYEVGFKNPSHFTVAFKNHFNYLPSHIKLK